MNNLGTTCLKKPLSHKSIKNTQSLANEFDNNVKNFGYWCDLQSNTPSRSKTSQCSISNKHINKTIKPQTNWNISRETLLEKHTIPVLKLQCFQIQFFQVCNRSQLQGLEHYLFGGWGRIGTGAPTVRRAPFGGGLTTGLSRLPLSWSLWHHFLKILFTYYILKFLYFIILTQKIYSNY